MPDSRQEIAGIANIPHTMLPIMVKKNRIKYRKVIINIENNQN